MTTDPRKTVDLVSFRVARNRARGLSTVRLPCDDVDALLVRVEQAEMGVTAPPPPPPQPAPPPPPGFFAALAMQPWYTQALWLAAVGAVAWVIGDVVIGRVMAPALWWLR